VTNIAVVGAGTMGTMHAASSRALPGATLAWVVDEDPERAASLAAPTTARATADLAEALADPALDAVILAVPTPSHRALTERAAAAGKHVFCEKPIALTLDDARAMTAACERAGVRFMVGHVVRFFPEYARIGALLDAGAIGEVGVVRASRVNAYPFVGRGWYSDFAWSGGPILDMMIHDLDTLRWYFGEIARVYARGLSYTPHRVAVDYALAIVRFANGVVAHVETSWAHSGFRTSIEIAGVGRDHPPRQRRNNFPAPRTDRARRAGRGGECAAQPAGREPYQTELRHFLDRIADGGPILTGGDEATRSLAAALAVLESVRTGRAIPFTDGWPTLESQGLVSDIPVTA
jgi:predicted dehydrogenase